MKIKYWLAVVLTVTFGSQLLAAQMPAGSTGQCKDGSYTSAAKKAGACSGHKGVQTWFAATGGAPTATPSPSTPSTPAPTAQKATASKEAGSTAAPSQPSAAAAQSSTHQQAPGGGPGMVWVNTSSKVYHCPGTEFYGTTKNGKYMSEADAVSMGARADHNKPCPK